MYRLFLALPLLALLGASAPAGQPQTVKFFVPGMTACPTCPYIVRSVLSAVAGVQMVETDDATGIATVTYDDATATLEGLGNALREYGYEAETMAPGG